MKYIYPAIFTKTSTGYIVEFPDLSGCFTQGKNFLEAFKMAEEVLSEYIIILENDKIEIPNSSLVEDISLKDDEVVNLISIDTIKYRREVSQNKVVKKTLTIPAWLNQIALNKNINFSLVLKKALIEELNLKDEI